MSISTTNHEVEKFDGVSNFGLWKIKMQALPGNLRRL